MEGSKHIHGGSEIQMFRLLLSKAFFLLQETQVGTVAVIHPEILQLDGALQIKNGNQRKEMTWNVLHQYHV